MNDVSNQEEGAPRPKSIWDRLEDMENLIYGTKEQTFRDGIIFQLRRIRFIQNIWGIGIVLALLSTGLINGNAARVIGEFLKGLGGG